MQTFLRRHRGGQHVQADGTCQLALEASGRDCDLGIVGDGLVRRPAELVQGQVPGLLRDFVRSHLKNVSDAKIMIFIKFFSGKLNFQLVLILAASRQAKP